MSLEVSSESDYQSDRRNCIYLLLVNVLTLVDAGKDLEENQLNAWSQLTSEVQKHHGNHSTNRSASAT